MGHGTAVQGIGELFPLHYSATPNTLILVLRDAVEVPVGAEENLTVGNGWRRVARLAQVIHGQKFELLRIGPKNGGDASSARDINRPAAITTEPQLSPPSSRSVHRIFPVWHSIH